LLPLSGQLSIVKRTNFTNREVEMSELFFLLVELSMYGTAYLILSVLLVLLLLRDLLKLLILVSFKCNDV